MSHFFHCSRHQLLWVEWYWYSGIIQGPWPFLLTDWNGLTNVGLVCWLSEKISALEVGVAILVRWSKASQQVQRELLQKMIKAAGENGTLWMTDVCNIVGKDGRVLSRIGAGVGWWIFMEVRVIQWHVVHSGAISCWSLYRRFWKEGLMGGWGRS